MTSVHSAPQVTLLTDEDKPMLVNFLEQSAPDTVYLRSMAHEFPVSPSQDPGHGRFFGAWHNHELRAVAFLGNSHNLCTHGDRDLIEPMLVRAEKAPVRAQLFVGPEEHAEAVRRFFARTSCLPRLDRRQYAYVLEDKNLPDTDPLPLSAARESDLPQVVEAHAAMIEEDLKIPRDGMNMVRLKTITQRRISEGRIWIHRQASGLVFKTEEVSRSEEGVLVGGVYTHPKFRGKGYAARGMASWAALLFRSQITRLALHVDAANEPAIKAYVHAGFERRGNLRLILCM